MVSLKSLTFFHSWRKLFPDVKDEDSQGFSGIDVNKLESTEVMNFFKGFGNVKESLERWLQS
jgi:hypothetical protein